MLDTTENGLLVKISDLVRENKFGQMVQCTRDGGKITRQMEWEDLFTPMVMCMMDTGLTIKLTDLEYTVI